MTGMLASIRDKTEAELILNCQIDIIDLKQPSLGALGALQPETVREIVDTVDKRCKVSATIGDLPMHPELIASAVEEMSSTGIDFVKIGFFPEGDWNTTISKLAEFKDKPTYLIAVLFADSKPDLNYLDKFKSAGFKGVMLDTMTKRTGSLVDIYPLNTIANFVTACRNLQLMSGLAGSLRQEDISPLMKIAPDYLGFRGALCQQSNRTNKLDIVSVKQIREYIDELSETKLVI